MDRDTILRVRRSNEGANVTLSYQQPLNITRAEGCEMWDDKGNRYLDCVNNVAHVGHCNKKVLHYDENGCGF
jgi:4-aminobutyrate aminotransferase-like enzyme